MRQGRSVARLVGAWVLAGLTLPVSAQEARDDEVPGPPAFYPVVREGEVEPAGRIRNGRLTVDRFELELTDGALYLFAPPGARPAIAVYLGKGRVRCYPPDGVEHQQLEKFLDDDDMLDAEFDRLVLWSSDDTGLRLRALATPDAAADRDLDKANRVLRDRRRKLLSQRLANPDHRVVVDLIAERHDLLRETRRFLHAEIDTDDHGWLTLEVEPDEIEEVRLERHDGRRAISDVWMGFHALSDFDPATRAAVFDGFGRDPVVEGKLVDTDGDDDDWHARDLGLSPRPLPPDAEGWSPPLTVTRTDVDLALEANGDATGVAALLVETHEPLITLRLRIARVLEVTDARWRPAPDGADDVRDGSLLAGETPRPDTPARLTGEPVNFIQETRRRMLGDDFYEPWVSVILPRPVAAGERFVVELAYHGKLLDNGRGSNNFTLKDTIYWMPKHADTRRTRMHLTYRLPERFRLASGSSLVDEQVVDGTRVAHWISPDPVRSMSFTLGRLDVSQLEIEGLPPLAVYENANHLGFAPGNREKTFADLAGTIRTYTDYFGPYPFGSLMVTETSTYSGQAFPGMVLLSFQAFGHMYSGEAEHFRAHEVAHQWWGAAVDWYDYRDQWISEGFANYAAALYTLSGLRDEDEFVEMLEAWSLDVRGEVNVGQGHGKHYGFRPAVIRDSGGSDAGPLVVGGRLVTSDSPADYQIQVYEKGAYILHMLRMMLTDLETGNDRRFRELMRTFVADHLTEVASTRSFEAAVTAAFGEPMDWFFDQWVYGVDIPTYRPDFEVTRIVDQDDPYLLHGTVRQEDVPRDFRMPVPLIVTFEAHPPVAQRIWVDAETVDVEIPLPAAPKAIDFNYHHGVLARVR